MALKNAKSNLKVSFKTLRPRLRATQSCAGHGGIEAPSSQWHYAFGNKEPHKNSTLPFLDDARLSTKKSFPIGFPPGWICKLRVRLVFVSDWFVPVQKLAENRTACLERWSVRPPRSPPVAKGAPCCSRLLLFASVVSVERPVSLKGNGNEHKETHSNLFLKGRGVEGGWKRTEKHEEAQFTTGRCF